MQPAHVHARVGEVLGHGAGLGPVGAAPGEQDEVHIQLGHDEIDEVCRLGVDDEVAHAGLQARVD